MSAFQPQLPSPLIPFTPPWEGASNVTMMVKRDDAIHPVVSGNKWRKLKHTIENLPPTVESIVSFGGGFSNHLHALGFVCHTLGLPFHAIVRGNYEGNESPMLNDLLHWHANLHYVNKDTYQKRHEKRYLAQLNAQFPNCRIVPEGGSQSDALFGLSELIDEIDHPFDTIIAPVASGATLAGIVKGLAPTQHALGIGVLKGEGYLESLVSQFLDHEMNWRITHDFHCGGYAKQPQYLKTFCAQFNTSMPFAIEPVYSGKVFYALQQLLLEGAFRKGERIVILHTGGLQGARPKGN